MPGRDCRIVLKIGKNARWDRQQRSALNRQNKRRIGEEILRDIEAGLTTEQAIAKRMKAKTFGRSYLFECLAEAAPKGPAYLRLKPRKTKSTIKSRTSRTDLRAALTDAFAILPRAIALSQEGRRCEPQIPPSKRSRWNTSG